MFSLNQTDPTEIDIAISGETFRLQRRGGISRYFVELLASLRSHYTWRIAVDGPVHVNVYLEEARRRGDLAGIALPPHLRFDWSPLRFRLLQLLRDKSRSKPDRLRHATYYDANFFSHACPNVATFYDMIHERCMPDDPIVNAKRRSYERADHLLAISESTKSDMLNHYGGAPERITVVHLATSLESRFPAASDGKPNPPSPVRQAQIPHEPYMLWVGDRRGYKNFDAALEAFCVSRFAAQGGRLICAGGAAFNAAEQEVIRSRVRRDQVTLQQCDDGGLVGLYRHAIALLYLSAYEGFGLPPLEAMQCGCPVIVGRHSSIPEVVGDAGLYVATDDQESIRAAIDEIAESPSLRGQLISAGKRRSSLFSWDQCARQTAACYRQLGLSGGD